MAVNRSGASVTVFGRDFAANKKTLFLLPLGEAGAEPLPATSPYVTSGRGDHS
jgi:hypothetical protein